MYPQQQPAPPLVVLALTQRLVAMNAHTGQRVWEYEIGYSQGRLFVEQGLVIYLEGATIHCLNYLTGALHWKAALPRKIASSGARVMVFAGCVIATGLGEAACFAMQNGAQVWHDTFSGYGSLSGALAAPGVSTQIDRA